MYADVVPADTTRWAIYRDQMFPFQMPLPPGWRYGAFVEDREGRTNCQEVVGLLPPNSSGAIVDGFDEAQQDYIALYVTINCTPYDPTGDPHDALEPSQVMFGGKMVHWYFDDLPPNSSSRVAVATFGNRSYEFLVVSPPSNTRADIALYLGMMKGFHYLD